MPDDPIRAGQVPPADPSQVDDPDAGQEPDAYDPDYVRKLRAESAKHRREAREAQGRLAQLEGAQLSELQRAQKELSAYQAKEVRWEAQRRETALERLFTAARAQYPELLAGKVNPSDITLADDGTITGGDRIVAQFRKQYPGLFGAGSGDGGAGRGAPVAGADFNTMIRQRAGRG